MDIDYFAYHPGDIEKFWEGDVVDKKEDKRKGKGKYWYFIYIYTCVLGDHEEEYRERRYTPKPKNWGDRHKITEELCGNHY